MEKLFVGLSDELLKNGIRPSYQRVKILEYLITQKSHPTVEQIFQALVKDIPTLSKATVYNTLNLLINAKLARVVTIEDNETRYDTIMKNHGHFKCKACGRIFDFAVNIDSFMADDLRGFVVSEKNVYFNGICPECFVYKKIEEGE